MQKGDRPESTSRAGEDAGYAQELLEMNNSQLLDEVDAVISLEHPNEEDMKRMEQCLCLLQERAPVMENYDEGKEWEELMQKYPSLLQTEAEEQPKRRVRRGREAVASRHRRTVHVLRFIEATVIMMFFLVITANALGHNPVQAFFSWADGIVQMYNNPSGIMELPKDSISEYRSLSQALIENGLDSSGCPTWIPRDYTVFSVEAVGAGGIDKYSAIYRSERGEILIRIIDLKQSYWSTTEERDDNGYTVIKDGIEYYIVTNQEQCKAAWSIGTCAYHINGQITEEEINRIIDSIKQGET